MRLNSAARSPTPIQHRLPRFRGPQGIIAAERWIEDIAYALGKDPLEIRKANFYGTRDNNITPYHQAVEDNVIHRVIRDLENRRTTRSAARPCSPTTSRAGC